MPAPDLLSHTAHNSSFSRTIPGLQIAWDSTSLGNLKHCPRHYYYTNILGYVSKLTSADLIFGIAIHKALETYDKEKAAGKDEDIATEEAVRAALWSCGTWDEANQKWLPWVSSHPQKTLYTLVRTVVWYLAEFGENDPARTVILDNGKPAVELSFRFALEDFNAPDGSSYYVCGHLDRLVEFGGQIHPMDRKSTKSALSPEFFSWFTPDNQMSLYSIAAKIVFGFNNVGPIIVDGIQVAVGFTRIMRGFVPRTPGQLDETLQDIQAWIRVAEGYALAEHWPLNDKGCFNCAFRPVCSKDPSVRQLFLDSHFVKATWDPLKPR